MSLKIYELMHVFKPKNYSSLRNGADLI